MCNFCVNEILGIGANSFEIWLRPFSDVFYIKWLNRYKGLFCCSQLNFCRFCFNGWKNLRPLQSGPLSSLTTVQITKWGEFGFWVQKTGNLCSYPVEQIGYLFGETPRMGLKCVPQPLKPLFAPEVQPNERHCHQANQTANPPPAPQQKILQAKHLLDPARGVFHAPAAPSPKGRTASVRPAHRPPKSCGRERCSSLDGSHRALAPTL